MCGTRSTPPGLTLIEVLTVMAVVSVLVGLLAPAIQRTREGANRAACGNHLRQVGLAIHMYQMADGRFPPSRLADDAARPGEITNAYGIAWTVLLLPYLEQDSLHRHWDLRRRFDTQTDVARLTPVPVYFCPSRRSPTFDPPTTVSSFPPSDPDEPLGARGDYAVSTDRSGWDYVHVSVPGPLRGAFEGPTGYQLAEFTDGLSSTLFVGERRIGGRGSTPYRAADGAYYCSEGGIARAASRTFPLEPALQPGYGFGAAHPGLVQFCFGDGHVRALALSTDPFTLELLGMRNDGEVVPDF